MNDPDLRFLHLSFLYSIKVIYAFFFIKKNIYISSLSVQFNFFGLPFSTSAIVKYADVQIVYDN